MHRYMVAITFGLLSHSSSGAQAQKPPVIGPYNTTSKIFSVPALDVTRREAWVVWPETSTPTTFPLLTYLHGDLGGGIDLLGYTELFVQLASYGFIVAAPFSCDTGCKDKDVDPRWTDCLPGLPPVGGSAWAPWYAEGLKTIDWVRNMSTNASADPVFHSVDWSAGIGLVGHSMGGQVREAPTKFGVEVGTSLEHFHFLTHICSDRRQQ
jgi:hypothetical protein